MTPEEFARESWQAAPATAPLPPLEDLRARADRFRRRIRRRNVIEYAAGAIVIAVFSTVALLVPLAMLRTGSALLIGGVCVVLWQLHRRGAPLSLPESGGQIPVLEYQRNELSRQRDALDAILVWYLLPLIPGMLAILSLPLFEKSFPHGGETLFDSFMRFGFCAIVFVAVYLLNKAGARRLQREIDEIDAMRSA